MSKILYGQPISEELNESMAKAVAELKEQGVATTIAILRVGEKDDDKYYERNVMIKAEKVGVEIRNVVLPESVSNDEFFETLTQLNEDDSVHGMLLMLPLPPQINEERVRRKLAFHKDIDGCTRGSLAGIFGNTDIGFPPCTPKAAMDVLHYYGIDIEGKKAVIVGRSLVAGKPMSMLLLDENATVTICHSKTKNVQEITRDADIVVLAAGLLEHFGAEYFSKGQTVIDVGINWSEEKHKICGDVKFDEVKDIVDAITPVPGGVGSVTTMVLIKHAVEAAKKTLNK